MNVTRIISEYDSLSADLRIIAFDFIQSLKLRKDSDSNNSGQAKNLDEIRMKFFGIWKDRNDIEDSSEWVRSLRRNEMG